jgi:hypothetical protein
MSRETRSSQESDLPRAIGQPARRALAAAGIASLAEVAEHTEAELLRLHGVGPRAVSVLRAALAARGSSFATRAAGG